MAQAQMSLDTEQKYAQKLFKITEEKSKCMIWTRDKYQEIVTLMTKEPAKEDKTPAYYYLFKKYEILQCGDVKKIIKRRQSEDAEIKYFVCLEDMYNVVQKIHIGTGHGGRDKMIKEANKKYANVLIDALELYKEMCEECQLKKRKVARKGLVVKPILSKEFNSRCQMDLIDMQSLSYDDYKYIMVYQDHLTKFVILRPLKSKRASEVALQVLDIFLLFGAPSILQSDNGAEFTAHVISDLKDLWPECKIVHGKPRHPQSQGSVERANADIKDMTITWMRENSCKDWPTGIKFAQFQKNQSFHSGIKRTPYKAMFGVEARVGLTSSTLPDELINRVNTETDLVDLVDSETRNPAQIVTDSPSATKGVVVQCFVCQKDSDTDLSCTTCNNIIHVDCGKLLQNKGSEQVFICALCQNEQGIVNERRYANKAMEKQAERMTEKSKNILDDVDIGVNVVVPIPQVDRGKGDPKNVMAVVYEKSEKGYRLATKHGILLGSYTRNQFEVTDSLFLTPTDINTDNFISLRRAVKIDSICDGQGFLRCGCLGKNRCETNRCACRKANMMCNSRCHPNVTCKNK